MKKSFLKIGILILVTAILFILSGKVNAATAPELKTFGTTEFFFANGTPITIVERTDGTAGAKIVWANGEQNVSANVNVFGGMHDDATEVNTSITMNGGTVRNIFGGGLHLSNTNTSNVVINGGKVIGVQGGGASSLTKDCGCTNATNWYAGNALNSPCQTKNANVTINGGNGFSLVFGGGEGISNTENANLTINGGDLSSAWITAGGSNGNTTNANMRITGGKLKVVQSVNRGTMKTVEVEVTGGTINKLYVGGETGDSTVTGKITQKATVEVSGDANVKVMELGKNDNVVVDSNSEIIKTENIKVLAGTVENLADDITLTYTVKIDGEVYVLEEGKTIKDLPEYTNLIKKDGYVFKGFKKGNEKFDENTIISSNIELTTSFEEAPKAPEKPDESKKPVTEDKEEKPVVEDKKDNEIVEDKKDETPKTGSLNVAVYTLSAIGIVALIGTVKSKNSKH